ncbi:MAG: hypothetical protein MR390_07625, partial [Oscillospiraceae bacterium]|nr:hypothetical protein [Oscillospiraceae bacterium]
MKKSLFLRVLSVLLSVLLIFEIMPVSVFAEDFTAVSDIIENEDVTNPDAEISNPEESEILPSTEVIGEIEEKREENVKHFMLSDSEYCAVSYPQSVHYKPDPDGAWVDIDNTLVEQTDSDGETYLAPEASPVGVKLKSDASAGELAEYTAAGHTVSWSYDGADFGVFKSKNRVRKSPLKNKPQYAENTVAAAVQNLEDSAQYRHFYKNVDIEYTVTPSGLKENLILKSPDVRNEFYSTYNIGALTPVQTDSRTVTLYDGEKEILTVSAPCMTDSINASSEDVSLTLMSAGDGKMKVKISASREWLDSPDREYPVTLDPYIFESKN